MEKVKNIDGGDYVVNLYSNNNFIGSRKLYIYCDKFFVKYKGRYGEILDFIDLGVLLASVDVSELYFK